MPNHVVNEIIFRAITPEQRAAILTHIVNASGEIDFEILVPPPINIWMGNVSVLHEKAFKTTMLDWATQNWGTKWNAYSQKPIEAAGDSLRLVFQTAWRPPYGWIVALLNTLKLPFDHNWLSQGDSAGRCGKFEPQFLGDLAGQAWVEDDAAPEMQKHLHVLVWGVESFADEEEANTDM